MAIDRRGKLEQEPFDVTVGKDRVLVYFRGRLVRTLTGDVVNQVRALQTSGDQAGLQLLIARKTGNFKRGNER